MLEIAFTRLFSVLLFYHYVFLVLAVALLGLGLGGGLAALLPDRVTRGQTYSAAAAGLAAIVTVGSVVVSARWLPSDWPLLHGAFALMPFLLLGVALPLLLSTRPASTGAIYGADLIGAALGTLAVFGLLWLSPIAAAFGSAALFAVASRLLRPIRSGTKEATALLAAMSLLFLIQAVAEPISIDLNRLSAGKPLNLWLGRAQAKIERSTWDPFSRTDVLFKPSDPQERLVFLDGSAGSSMPHYPADSNEEMRRRTELGYFPYKLVDAQKALIIGSGGGLGVLHAILARVPDITAVEVSPGAIAAVRADNEYNGFLYDRPDVHVETDEGRSFLERSAETYDVIDMSLVISLATAQSGFALTENYLFTVEAFETALDRLSDNGMIAVRLYDDPTLTRAFLTAATALRNRESSDAAAVDHLAVVFNPKEATQGSPAFYPMLLISKQPFTADSAQAMVAEADTANYDVVFAPFVAANGPFGKVANGEASLTGIRGELTGGTFTPATDAQPFFFEMSESLPRPLIQSWIAVAVVVIGFLFAVLVKTRSSTSSFREQLGQARSLTYFALLGIGFIIVELTLLARLTLVLGHPVIALATVLGGLLLAGGAGSLVSRRFATGGSGLLVTVAALVAAVMTLALPTIIDRLPNGFLSLPLTLRIAIVVLGLLPLGIAMGTLLPTGLRRFDGDATLPWAVNGIGSVVGSVLATTVALTWGYPVALALGAAIYAVVAATGPLLLRHTMATRLDDSSLNSRAVLSAVQSGEPLR